MNLIHPLGLGMQMLYVSVDFTVAVNVPCEWCLIEYVIEINRKERTRSLKVISLSIRGISFFILFNSILK